MDSDVRKKIDDCLSRSCSEFDACIKSVQQSGGEQSGQQQGQGTQDPKGEAKKQACQKEKINACLAKPCGEFQACINSLSGGGGEQQGGTPDPAIMAKFKSCQPPPPPSGDGGGQQGGGQQQQSGDQSQIPQGFSSWEAFCRANSGDSRCAPYQQQYQQQYQQPPQYPYQLNPSQTLLQYSPFGAILNFFLGL